jgi:hypothetical protein
MKKLIGLTGKKGSGKDTAAAALVNKGYVQVRFAQPLKLMIGALLAYQNVDQRTAFRMINGDLKEMPSPLLCGRSARHAMQTIGTEWGRDCIAPELWVGVALEKANQSSKCVISDVRYKNEADAIKAAGGTVIRILRNGCNGDGHSSESMDFCVDYEVCNNGTIKELHDIIEALETTI